VRLLPVTDTRARDRLVSELKLVRLLPQGHNALQYYSKRLHFPFISTGLHPLHSVTVTGAEPGRLIEMCMNETYSKLRIGKYLSDTFLI
jgi:hypothetical protein